MDLLTSGSGYRWLKILKERHRQQSFIYHIIMLYDAPASFSLFTKLQQLLFLDGSYKRPCMSIYLRSMLDRY